MIHFAASALAVSMLLGCGPALELQVVDGESALTFSGSDVVFGATFVALPEDSLSLESAQATIGERVSAVSCLRPDRTDIDVVRAGDEIVCLEQGEVFGPELDGQWGEAVITLRGAAPSPTPADVVRGYALRKQGPEYQLRGLWRVLR
jgi:hypothetical protein